MDLNCPACAGVALQPLNVRQDTLYKCPQCDGLWFDRDDLVDVEHLPDSELMSDFQDQLVSSPAQMRDSGRGRTCPHCSKDLESHRYDYSSSIWVDSCPDGEGVWLDCGEVMAVHKHLDDSAKELTPERRAALNAQLAQIAMNEDKKFEEAVLAPYHHQGHGATVPVWHAMDGVFRVAYHLLYKLGV